MHRALLWSLVLLVPLPAARAQEQEEQDQKKPEVKKKAESWTFKDQLRADDPKDKVKTESPHKVHTVKLAAGKTYQIDMVSRAFDCFLRLEDKSGKELAENDDAAPGTTNSRILFKAPKKGTYRVIATSFDGKAGPYTVTVKEASATALAATKALEALQKDLQKDFFGMYQKLNKDYADAKTDAEKDKLFEGFSAGVKKLEDAFAKIAKDYPGEEAARQASMIATQLKFTVTQIKSQIVLSAGDALQTQYEKAFEAKDKNAGDLYKRAEKYFEDGAKKYAKDPQMASQFNNKLYVLQKLSVGKTAPEIEAEDLDARSSSSPTIVQRWCSLISGGIGEGLAGPCTPTSGRS